MMNGGCRTGRACASRRGQLRAARGDEEAVRKDFHTAIEIFEKLESRLELGRALVVRGGVEDIRKARELFEACGVVGDWVGYIPPLQGRRSLLS